MRRAWSGLVVLCACLTAAAAARQSAPREAVPVDAITGILDAFKNHQIVALSDAHGNAQAHAFLSGCSFPPRSSSMLCCTSDRHPR